MLCPFFSLGSRPIALVLSCLPVCQRLLYLNNSGRSSASRHLPWQFPLTFSFASEAPLVVLRLLFLPFGEPGGVARVVAHAVDATGLGLDFSAFRASVWEELAKLKTEFQQDGEAIDDRLSRDAEHANILKAAINELAAGVDEFKAQVWEKLSHLDELNNMEQNINDGFHAIDQRVAKLETEFKPAAEHEFTAIDQRFSENEVRINALEKKLQGAVRKKLESVEAKA
jgi:hypothetical protein